jgi:hypothetical protein
MAVCVQASVLASVQASVQASVYSARGLAARTTGPFRGCGRISAA